MYMKMTKQDRDSYVLQNHSIKTNAQLVTSTGWSLTTIKSIKRRLGVVSSPQVTKLRTYILENRGMTYQEIADTLGMKIDNVRDTAKALGMVDVTASDKSFNTLHARFQGRFKFSRGDYITNKERIPITCRGCNFSFTARPNTMVTDGLDCPGCSPRWQDKPAVLYVMELQETGDEYEIGRFKVGIALNADKRRQTLLRSEGYDHLMVMDEYAMPNMSTARAIETAVHKILKNFNVYGSASLFDGSTEIFEIDLSTIRQAISACST